MSSSARTARSADSGGKGGGKGPELKRRRLLDAGGPIEDDETARQKMRDAEVYERGGDGALYEYDGFDPDNVEDVKMLFSRFGVETSNSNAIRPMGYFARIGDLRMMRWLYVNGADTRGSVDVDYLFPMWSAARHGHLDVCKWLFQHGAAGDIKRRASTNRHTPFSVTFDESDKRNVGRWLILRGALCTDGDTGDLDVGLMRDSLNRHNGSARERPELLKWAREHHQSRSSFGVFLMGTLSAPTYSVTKLRNELLARNRSEKVVDRILANIPSDECRLLWDDLFPRHVCPLAVFAGKSGILELIGDYVGIMRGREARIIRQLTELLPGLIEELENRRHESSSDSDDSDESSDDSDH